MRRAIVSFVAIVAAGGLLVACSGDEEFPVGTYVSAANVNDLGPVTAAYHEDGTLTVSQGGEMVAEGTYTVDGDRIDLSDEYCASEGQETATYTWAWDGSVLTMTTTDDACESRKSTVAEMMPAE